MFEGKYNSAPCPKDTMSHRLLAPFISARGCPIFGLTLSPNKKESPPTDGMREYGIRPVLPGYSGMVPHNAKERLGLNVSDPGLWCGYRRPAFLQPTDPRFNEIADLYYKEMSRLYGKADFYSMDPFHEGGNVAGVDLNAAGQAIWGAKKRHQACAGTG